MNVITNPRFKDGDFLSCLCGSEHRAKGRIAAGVFLSCLCGSELSVDAAIAAQGFLSCLCGSERQERMESAAVEFSELPMRQ